MLMALPAVTALGGWEVVPHLTDPVALAAGVGVGVTSSVIPYVCDQLAMARLARATYSLMVSLLPATATVVGLVVLGQTPTPRSGARDLAGRGRARARTRSGLQRPPHPDLVEVGEQVVAGLRRPDTLPSR